ncbi:MAG: helix-turn-helix domain-containing protein [Actinobacteria bacterium]|nr:helix-turn-helix domain-containing protein [Actinomycetota bacterium]
MVSASRPGSCWRQAAFIPGVTLPPSDNELGVFLRSRRERITPAQAGLPAGYGARRTPGLRREEVATLARVSIDYYTRLERGRERHPSVAVLDALAGVLGLDDAERAHLQALAAHAAGNGAPRPAAPSPGVRETSLVLLAAVRPCPAAVVSRGYDVLAANPGGLAIFHGLADWPPEQRNLSRYLFLHPAARSLWADWESIAAGHVADLRSIAGQDPGAQDIAGLVEGLLAESQDFARLWSRYDVKPRSAGEKRYQHPLVGRMTLCYENLPLTGAGGQRLIVYLARPGTADHDAMVLLDKLAAARADVPDRDRGQPAARASTGS